MKRSKENRSTNTDSLLSVRGTGKQLWADEHADVYVRRLREDWQTPHREPTLSEKPPTKTVRRPRH